MAAALRRVEFRLVTQLRVPRRRREFHAGAARLGEPDGDGLLRGARAVLALAHVVNLLAHELSRLRGRRLALGLVLASAL